MCWSVVSVRRGHSRVEYFLYKILKKYIMQFIMVAQMDHQKYSILFVLFIADVLWQCLFLGALYHKIVHECHFTTIFFSSWGRAFLFSSLLPKEMWGEIYILVKLKTTLRNQYASLLRKRLWSLSKWGWDCWALHCEWLCSEQKGVISSLFYCVMKPKWLQWAVLFFEFLIS